MRQGPSTNDEEIVLVDENDAAIGTAGKTQTHLAGLLHRAFSIFVFNWDGQLLLQQRAHGKYHSRGLWSNTCCGHPRPNETLKVAARRRLKEEMGFDCELTELLSLTYNVAVNGGMFEHEFNHIFIGHFNDYPVPNDKEVADWKWMSAQELLADLENNTEYTAWFRLSVNTVLDIMFRQCRVLLSPTFVECWSKK